MPQAGQGAFSKTIEVQGGKPNCWWVPKPDDEGSSQRASTSNASTSKPEARQVSRSHHFNGPRGGRWKVLVRWSIECVFRKLGIPNSCSDKAY